MDQAKLRAWWWHRQGLDGSLEGADPATVLARTGWARSVGGSNPYFTLFARAGTARADVDAAVARLDIYELPSARGCTYILPANDFGLGLQVGRGTAEGELKVLDKLGVPRQEIEDLGAAVMAELERGQRDPAELKSALGDAVRSLGEGGRKRGQSTTLPAALGLLQERGEIRRVPANGRLDQQRYAYARWTPPEPAAGTAEEARAILARRYFGWTGAATLAHFRWFSGYGVATAKAAVAGAGLVDIGDGLLALPEDAAEFAEYTPPAEPQYHLLASIDALILLRRDAPALFDQADGERPLPGASGPMVADPDLTDHPIVDRGRIVGLWQYDADARRIVWWSFDEPDKALIAAVERTEEYIASQLGDARSVSLDSPKSRAPRLAALRAAAAGTGRR
jgi:hypothetical protein